MAPDEDDGSTDPYGIAASAELRNAPTRPAVKKAADLDAGARAQEAIEFVGELDSGQPKTGPHGRPGSWRNRRRPPINQAAPSPPAPVDKTSDPGTPENPVPGLTGLLETARDDPTTMYREPGPTTPNAQGPPLPLHEKNLDELSEEDGFEPRTNEPVSVAAPTGDNRNRGCAPKVLAIAAVVVALIAAAIALLTQTDDSPSTPEKNAIAAFPKAEVPFSEPVATANPSPSVASTQAAGARTIDGTYDWAATVMAGSNPACTANSGQFVVAVSGAGTDRRLSMTSGGTVSNGRLHPDNSFETTAPVTTGTGADTLVGTFDLSRTPVTFAANDTLVGQTSDGVSATCKYQVTGHKI